MPVARAETIRESGLGNTDDLSTGFNEALASDSIQTSSPQPSQHDEATAFIREVLDSENPLRSRPNGSDHSGMEEVIGSPLLRGKLMGDATRASEALRQFKIVAQKKQKSSNIENTIAQETSKRIKHTEIGRYLSDMIDEANAMYVDPSFHIPTQAASTEDTLFGKNTKGLLAAILHLLDDSDSERLGQERATCDSPSLASPAGKDEGIFEHLQDTPSNAPTVGMGPPIIPSGGVEVPSSHPATSKLILQVLQRVRLSDGNFLSDL